ncbi:plastocyanin/azurin family copper-binding protein [Polaribacter atrinae]|uniref:Blue (type 1) copper domain-containing protein n=1 Tax=Polaribacter atrinae TaxID=1333662 RepID=A0A176TFG2_9FLAO|nr:plastocyanin/azurin family copper-binding protein [Polaribacter atrinae]OAD46283.1 hypothetical protein LPB303_01740 [Polaribacter atrinae]
MKKVIAILVVVLGFAFSTNAQDKMDKAAVKTVSLEQTKGEFTQKQLTLSEGTYIFEVANNNVGHNVGFVLAPKADAKAHIKNAYVTAQVKNNTKETSKEVTLTKGEYVYFCPLNPTPQYTLIVE